MRKAGAAARRDRAARMTSPRQRGLDEIRPGIGRAVPGFRMALGIEELADTEVLAWLEPCQHRGVPPDPPAQCPASRGQVRDGLLACGVIAGGQPFDPGRRAQHLDSRPQRHREFRAGIPDHPVGSRRPDLAPQRVPANHRDPLRERRDRDRIRRHDAHGGMPLTNGCAMPCWRPRDPRRRPDPDSVRHRVRHPALADARQGPAQPGVLRRVSCQPNSGHCPSAARRCTRCPRAA
jgi:hypothetical protein